MKSVFSIAAILALIGAAEAIQVKSSAHEMVNESLEHHKHHHHRDEIDDLRKAKRDQKEAEFQER